MKDKLDKLSILMDGELRQQRDQKKIIDQLVADKEMQSTWKRYHLARDVMKGQLSAYPTLDVSAAVSQSLQDEPAIFTPIWRRLTPRYVMKQAAGLAVAAAVGTIAVLTVQQTQLFSANNNLIANAAHPAPISLIAAQKKSGQIRQVRFTTRHKLDAAVEAKLSGYLVNHNEFSTSIRVSGVMPYTRIVSFVPTPASPLVSQENDDK